MQRLDWDDLRVFLDIAKARSLTRAARALGIDHSTVSRRLTRLEYAVGAALFERARDGVRLTETGVAVLRRVDELSASIAALSAELADSGPVGGTVRVATMEGIASLWLTPRLSGLRDKAPELHVELVTSPQQVQLSRREADLFLSFFKPHGRMLVSERLGGFSTGLWASDDYLARFGMPAGASALQDHAFVGYIDDLVQVEAVRWGEELVPRPRLVFTSNSMIAQMGAARGGLGLVCLPSFAGAAAAGLTPVLPGAAAGHRELWLSVHPDLANAPKARAVGAYLRALIAADPAFTR